MQIACSACRRGWHVAQTCSVARSTTPTGQRSRWHGETNPSNTRFVPDDKFDRVYQSGPGYKVSQGYRSFCGVFSGFGGEGSEFSGFIFLAWRVFHAGVWGL